MTDTLASSPWLLNNSPPAGNLSADFLLDYSEDLHMTEILPRMDLFQSPDLYVWFNTIK